MPLGQWHNLSMEKAKMRRAMTPTEFEAAFVARTQALRKTKFNAAKDMATALGIPAERYAKYETRTPLPHELIEPFALIVGVPVAYLITGRRTYIRGGGGNETTKTGTID